MRAELQGLEALDRLAGVFASLGSAPRLRLLFLLYLRPDLKVGQMAEMTGLTISGVSMHLRRLRESGLVCCRRDGQAVCCTLPENGDHVRFLGQLFCQIAAETGCCKT
jgi:DNA-binding transcriptional ArsR family regulator